MTQKQRNHLVAVRKLQGLSKADLAKMTGLSYATIIGIERGYKSQQNPSVKTLKKICKALGMDAGGLI